MEDKSRQNFSHHLLMVHDIPKPNPAKSSPDAGNRKASFVQVLLFQNCPGKTKKISLSETTAKSKSPNRPAQISLGIFFGLTYWFPYRRGFNSLNPTIYID